jgi:hypothetical protein
MATLKKKENDSTKAKTRLHLKKINNMGQAKQKHGYT